MTEKIFKLSGDIDNFHSIVFAKANNELLDVIEKMNTEPIKDLWPSPKLEIRLNEEIIEGTPLSDCPFLLSKCLVFTQRAYELLRDTFSEIVESFPIVVEEHTFFLINPLRLIDALDKERSSIEWYKDRILYINNYVLKSEAIPLDLPIFRVNGAEDLALFVSEEVWEKVCKAHLTGFNFEEVQCS